MPHPESISASQIQLYLACSLKYRFTYVDHLPKLTLSANQVFGTAIHAAISWLHKERKRSRIPTLDEILRVFEADWNAQVSGRTVLYDDKDPAGILALLKGKELLGQYYTLPADPIRESELRFTLPLINPGTGEILDVPLKGVIDLVHADDTVDEFKTSARAWSLGDVTDNMQLTTYGYAFAKLFGRPAKDIRLVNLVKTKAPRIDVQVTGREPADYERLFAVAKEVVHAVRSGVFLPNRGCWMCADCEYDQDCREWTGNEERQEVVVSGQSR